MPTTSCTCCSATIEKHLVITCSVCKKDYWHTCVGITQAEIRTINMKGKNLSWNCANCNAIGNDINALKAVILSLQNEVRDLKTNRSQSMPVNFSLEEAIEEIEERQKRKDNVIIFGIAEQNSSLDKNDRLNKEISAVTGLIREVFPNCSLPENHKVYRLGKYNAANIKPRPIRVALDERSVHTLIRNFSTAKRNRDNLRSISISFDRTPKQLQHLNALKAELETRKGAGETNLKIKFVRGHPKIISEN